MFYEASVDAYGFERPGNFDYESYEKFMETYLAVLQRRAGRWKRVLGEEVEKEKLKTHLKGRQFKRFVRKGIPSTHRALIWMMSSGAQEKLEANPGYFEDMLRRPKDPEVMEQINLDLHRTFPDNVYFKNRDEGHKKDMEPPDCIADGKDESSETSNRQMSQEEKHKQDQLKKVLTAFANHNPTVGYCQGLNFVSGLLLLIVEDEECTFWLLDALVNRILPDYYSKDMIGLRSDTRALGQLVQQRHSDIAQLMEREGVTWDLVVSRWLLCLFVDVLPVETVLRIWDVLFNEGSKILFRVSLTLIKNGEPKLLTCQNFPSIVTTFAGMMKDPLALHCHAFMFAVFEQTGSLASKEIEQNRENCRKQVKEEDAQFIGSKL